MPSAFLNQALIDSFPVKEFASRQPFPWANVGEFLLPEAFATLLADFPPLSLFAWHEGMERHDGQRPQDRWYLAYDESPYPDYEGGVAKKADLPESWQGFIDELETNRPYQRLMAKCLGQGRFTMRYAWHVGVNSSEVSPHVDDPRKAATHIFYFNTSDDWDPAWGGSTLVLGGKPIEVRNPDFPDFATSTPVQTLDNHSFLFRNTPDAWHGVAALTSPDDRHRRLFNVVFERAAAPTLAPAKLAETLKRKVASLRS